MLKVIAGHRYNVEADHASNFMRSTVGDSRSHKVEAGSWRRCSASLRIELAKRRGQIEIGDKNAQGGGKYAHVLLHVGRKTQYLSHCTVR